jgi:phage/plasmid-like protein (TIGR03299 family)
MGMEMKMSHMIDVSNGRPAIAYVGETPWHKLGQQLTKGADIEVWRREAGLNYSVLESPITFERSGYGTTEFPGRKALYRSDSGLALGILGKDYKTVQPGVVLDFFKSILEREGATLEVAGALDDGKRVWALAKLAEGADILDGDIVEPYLLCATSYDGSMSTVAKLTAIRVVCHNTITAAVGGYVEGQGNVGQTEKNREGGIIRVPHSADFDPDATRIDLGITMDSWERFLFVSRKLARTQVDDTFVVEFLKRLLPAPVTKDKDGNKVQGNVEESKPFLEIMSLFNGRAIGSEMKAANGTAYGLLNAVTEFVDHSRDHDGRRLSSAWFGTGEGLKNKALSLLERIAA